MPPSILLTIDVEDWFQVENFKQYIPFSTWSSYDFRVEKNVHRLLDLFDSCNPQPATRKMERGYELSAISYEQSSKKNIKATPVPSAGFNPGFSRGATGQAGQAFHGVNISLGRRGGRGKN